MVRIVLTVLLALALLACTPPGPTEELEPSPEATVAPPDLEPDATPVVERGDLPQGYTGTLVVYAKMLPGGRPDGDQRWELVTYDMESRRPLASFEVESEGPLYTILVGTRIVSDDGRTLRSYSLDGTEQVVLARSFGARFQTHALGSPDGLYVAFAGATSTVALIDVRTGDRVLEADVSEELSDFEGVPQPTGWPSSGGLLLTGTTSSEQPGSTALMEANGTLRPLTAEEERALRAEPRLERAGTLPADCSTHDYELHSSVRIVDGASGDVRAQVELTGPVIEVSEMSPDGREALLLVRGVSESIEGQLAGAVAAQRCPSATLLSRVQDAPRRWYLLISGVQGLAPVTGHYEAMFRWYGDYTPSFLCGGEDRAGYFTRGWATGEVWVTTSGFGQPYGYLAQSCNDDRARIDLRVGGRTVDQGGRDYRVLGFIDPP